MLKSSIVHVFGDSFTGDSVITVGNLWIYRSGYRMEAEGRIILIADSISKVYHQEKNQLIISPYSAEDDDFAPSRFIEASEEDLWAIQEQEKNGFFQINLTSEDEFAPFTMIIILLNDQYCPIQVETIDSNGNTNKTIFQNPKWIPFSDDILKIDYPKSTEIIDLH